MKEAARGGDAPCDLGTIEEVDACHEKSAAIAALQALMLPDDDLAGVPKAGFYALLGLINRQ